MIKFEVAKPYEHRLRCATALIVANFPFKTAQRSALTFSIKNAAEPKAQRVIFVSNPFMRI